MTVATTEVDHVLEGARSWSSPRIRLHHAIGYAAFPLLWDGIPYTMIGLPIWYGKWTLAAIILAFTATYLVDLLTGRKRLDFWFVMPVILLAVCAFASAVSSSIFFPQPVTSWLFAMYTVTPLLMIAVYRQTGAQPMEVIAGIVVAAVFISLLIIVDRVVHLSFLDVYRRLSGFDEEARRIVLAKNDIAAATVILGAATMLNFPKKISIIYLGLFSAVFYTLIVVFETRVAIAAVMIALASFAVVYLRGQRRLFIIIASGVLSIILVPLLFGKYIDQVVNTADFASQDQSVLWRLITVNYYRQFFDFTAGIGFGVMSGSGDTLIGFAQYKAGALYGDPWYGLYLADISLYSALYQFGYAGLLCVVIMEVAVIVGLFRASRTSMRSSKIIGALGLLVLFLVVNVWPLNMFTLEWCLVNSGALWFLASQSSKKFRQGAGSVPAGFLR